MINKYLKNKYPVEDNPSLEDYLQWDIYVWSKALSFWTDVLKSKKINGGSALEIGSRNGGLSLYLAHEFNFNVISTDIDEAPETAKQLHKKYGADKMIKYEIADAADLKYEPNTFDAVIFKSVLGSIGKNNNIQLQKKAVNEMHRVLKPGGILLFAENSKATYLHRIFRKVFRKWASYWRYVTFNELSDMLSLFQHKEVKTAGFISAFFPNKNLKKIIFPLDNFLERIISQKSRYVIYGYAVK